MRDLSAVVEQLRSVREAQRKFLQMWAVEQAVIVPGLDRVAADMNSAALESIYGDPQSINRDDSGLAFGQ